MIHALLPAAGHSRRLGKPKLALTLGGETVLQRVLTTLREAQVEKTLLVLAPHVAFLEAIARQKGAEVLLLPEATPDMRATIELGLAWMEAHWEPHDDDYWLLLPPDHPVLSAHVIQQLGSALASDPSKTIALPVHNGKRGHPALIAFSHRKGMAAFPRHLGLNSYLREHLNETIELPWPTDDVLLDLDTPDDYERLRARVSGEGEPIP